MTLKRGIYILPAIFTLANIACGMMSIFSSVEGVFATAAWLIIIAIVLDMIDGRVARLTNTQSLFGVNLDSFADLISFGVAPSFMMYKMVLAKLANPGAAIAVFYVIAVTLRLAKFNVKAIESDGESESFFEGLPSPAGAGILASFVLSYELFEAGQQITVKTIPIIEKRMPFFLKSIPVMMVLVSLLMISTLRYAGFKKVKFNRAQSFQVLALAIISFLLILSYPEHHIHHLYMLSGIRHHRLYHTAVENITRQNP